MKFSEVIVQQPEEIKIYHIVHVDRLSSILDEGQLYCDAYMVRNPLPGTTIGISDIKGRRLTHFLKSHPDLRVGDCVPFYFCPRSVMLYLFWKNNHPDLTYHGGQEPIIHLVADLKKAVDWAENNNRRWAFTTSNAGANSFDDYNSLDNLHKVDWSAVDASFWAADEDIKAKKQAEFLIAESFPWELIESIGVHSESVLKNVEEIINLNSHKPEVSIERPFYYP